MAQSENGRDKDFVLSSDHQSQDILESRDDTHYEPGSGASGEGAFKHIYIAIGGFLILIVLCVVLIARTYSLAEKAQLLALESRLEQLEGRLGSLEGEGALSQTGGSGNPLILLTERLDQLEANMTARMNSMLKELNSPPLSPASKAVQKTEAAETTPAVKKELPDKTHTVKQGDTLYRISRRYNLSVEQLRQYNKLDPKASIYPGQKLKITPPK
ncbi:MAG: LysM peptidoglycan-binding domain-containing protein [Desulfobacterales bacterium]|jgi:LysM repeat protein